MASASCAPSRSLGRSAPHGIVSIRAVASKIAARAGSVTTSPENPGVVRVEYIAHYTIVQNAGSEDSFTLFATSITYAVVSPDSSAVVEARDLGPARFASSSDAHRWKVSGRPPLPDRHTTTGYQSFSAGEFSFTPQGTPLTYGQAQTMPAQPQDVMATIRRHLLPYSGPRVPAELILKQLGFLLAAAPLSRQARKATWLALASLPGARLCGTSTDLLGRRGEGICASVPTEEIEVLVDPFTAQVLAVVQRVLQPTPLFPGIPVGTVVESDTFTTAGR
jgi:hypothetical protein